MSNHISELDITLKPKTLRLGLMSLILTYMVFNFLSFISNVEFHLTLVCVSRNQITLNATLKELLLIFTIHSFKIQ